MKFHRFLYVAELTSCADPESFVRRGPALTTFFFLFFKRFDKKRGDPNAIMLADDSLTLNADMVSL